MVRFAELTRAGGGARFRQAVDQRAERELLKERDDPLGIKIVDGTVLDIARDVDVAHNGRKVFANAQLFDTGLKR